MSSNESSGASAEASSTTPAPSAEFPTFGSTRGSGLARGKRPAAGPAVSTAATSNYTPTAIEVVNAPREYTNPFAPAEAAPAVEAPVAAQPAPVIVTAPVVAAPVVRPAPVAYSAPVAEEPAAELNILPPAEQKTTTAQTWESDGFSPAAREPRGDRPRREPREPREPRREEAQSQGDESVDTASIPEKFLYVRPGVTFVPTPRNWGGAPRERSNRPAGEGAPQREESPSRSYESSTSSAAPAKSGGFFGWLKSLFGGSSSAEPVSAGASSSQHREGGDRHRGGRNRSSRGGEGGGSGGGQRRSRGGRGRGRSGGGYPPAEGSSQGGI